MSSSVSIDIPALESAIGKLTDLAGRIETQRNRVLNGTPCAVPSLSDSSIALVSTWLKDQEPELSTRLDLAKLLDTKGAGVATYTTDADTLANVQSQLGKELANRVNDVSYDTDNDDLKTLNDILARRADDAKVMSAMYQDLQPSGTARVISVLESNLHMTGAESAMDLAETLRKGLQTASKDTAFPGEQYGKDMVRWFTAPMLSDDEQRWAEEHDMMGMNGASLLAFMMRGGDYSPTFLKGAANELDQFEQLSKDGPMGDATVWYGHNGYSEFNEGEEVKAGDPMAEMMRAMSRQPAVGMEFLNDEDRRNYYFSDRDWSQDGYDGVSALADSVSTDADNLKNDPHLATTIAADFGNKIFDRDDFDPKDAKEGADSVSHLLSFYMPSVANTLDGEAGDGDTKTTGHLTINGLGTTGEMPIFYRDDLGNLTKVAMSTEDSMKTMAEGVGGYTGQRVNNLAADLGADPKNPDVRGQLRGALMDDAQLQGYMERMAGETEIDEADNAEQQRQYWSGLVSDAIDFVPVPGSKVAGEELGDWASKGIDYAWNHGTEYALDGTSHAISGTPTPDEARASASGRAADHLRGMNLGTYHALLESGAIEKGPPSWYDHGQLKDIDEIKADPDQSAYNSDATAGMAGIISDEDLENTYKTTFQTYYEKATG